MALLRTSLGNTFYEKKMLNNFLFCLCHFSGNSPIVYDGLVGGNVTFYCPVAQESQLEFLYFQKVVDGKSVFLNGYHSKPLINQLPNTEMDQNHTMMHIYRLNLSDSGEYQCYYRYKNAASGDLYEVQIYLNVTGRQVFNIDVCLIGVPSDCNVTCHSHNGLSGKRMEWNVPGNVNREMWRVLLNDESPSRDELVSISSTANFNCSVGEVKVSCSVDTFTSEIVSACNAALQFFLALSKKYRLQTQTSKKQTGNTSRVNLHSCTLNG
uniref:Immunoglobulin domain-containing protein n=1 Tax=Poecilia latipinna TaxID=48699 RepID=A0A3B3U8M6_9TELE